MEHRSDALFPQLVVQFFLFPFLFGNNGELHIYVRTYIVILNLSVNTFNTYSAYIHTYTFTYIHTVVY